MDDQIIDAAMARSLHADALRAQPLAGWVVMWDLPEYSHKFIARLLTDVPCPYVLIADALAGLEEQLPPGLVRSERQPAEPPEVVEGLVRGLAVVVPMMVVMPTPAGVNNTA